MNYETINAVRLLHKTYSCEQRRLNDLRFLAYPSPPKIDGMPHAQSPSSKTESIATLIIECERRIDELTTQLEQTKFHLLNQLDKIAMRELPHRVLNYHYVGCQSFASIARIMHFTKQYIFNLHDEGIRACGLDVRELMEFKRRHQLSKV